MPTGKLADTGPARRVPPLPSDARSQTCVVNPAGTVIAGKPCCPINDQPIGERTFTFGSRGAVSFLGGTLT